MQSSKQSKLRSQPNQQLPLQSSKQAPVDRCRYSPRDLGDVPEVSCSITELNQVFLQGLRGDARELMKGVLRECCGNPANNVIDNP